MTYPVSQIPIDEPVPETPIHLRTALVAIWLHPRTVLTVLAEGSGWSWIAPIGLALLVFYTRFFTLAILGSPVLNLTLLRGVAGILIGWPLSAAILYGLTKLAGSRPGFMPILVMCAWATLPLTLRNAVQVIYMWAAGQLLPYPGLSGLLAHMDAAHWAVRVGQMLLGRLDLFTLWHLGLLVLALSISAQRPPWKAAFVVGLYAALILVFGALVMLI